MIVIGGFIFGAIFGAMLALRRGGNRLDALHYGAAFAIMFTLFGMLLTIIIERML